MVGGDTEEAAVRTGLDDGGWRGGAHPETWSKFRADGVETRLGRSKAFTYIYDFGENWHHTVKLEAIIAAEPEVRYPRLISAERACRLEDVGGPWGYADYLGAVTDPAHERPDEIIEWSGGRFDLAAVDEAAIRKRLSALASRPGQARSTRAPRTAKAARKP